MYRVAVIGDRDSIYGYAALGLDTFSAASPQEGASALKNAAESNYAVIFLTEALAEQISDVVDIYRTQQLPAVILIPGVTGNTGRGIADVKRSVEQAVGSDIIFGGN